MKTKKSFLAIILIFFLFSPCLAQPDFTWHTISTALVDPLSQDAADLDGDGDLDVICTGRNDPVRWWENLGGQPPEFDGHFLPDNLEFGLHVKAEDLDNDGDMDIVATGSNNGDWGNCLKWWENNGDNPVSFIVHDLLPDQRIHGPVGTGDLDNDGDIDIVTSGLWGQIIFTEKIIVFENLGEGLFDSLTFEFTGWGPLDLSLDDLDGDEDLDIVYYRANSNPSGYWWM